MHTFTDKPRTLKGHPKALQPTLTLAQADEIVLAFLNDSDSFAMIEDAEEHEHSVLYFLDTGEVIRVSKIDGKLIHQKAPA